MDIPMDKIVGIDSCNIRKKPNPKSVSELKKTMAAKGLIQPILVRKIDGDKYTVLIGQERYLAAKALGWETIRGGIFTEPEGDKGARDESALELSFLENVRRDDIDPRDRADALHKMIKNYGDLAKLSDRLGIAEQTLDGWHKIVYFTPDVPIKVDKRDREGISMSTAKEIVRKTRDEIEQKKLARKVSGLPTRKAIATIKGERDYRAMTATFTLEPKYVRYLEIYASDMRLFKDAALERLIKEFLEEYIKKRGG